MNLSLLSTAPNVGFSLQALDKYVSSPKRLLFHGLASHNFYQHSHIWLEDLMLVLPVKMHLCRITPNRSRNLI